MLTRLSLKLCPLLTLALATISCGKKIADQESSTANQTQNQERPSAYILRLDGTKESIKQFKVPQDVKSFPLPETISVKSGSAIGKTLEIAYNVVEEHDDIYEYKCNYVGVADTNIMVRTQCFNEYDEDFGNVTNETFQIYEGQIIQLRFVNSPRNNPVVDVIYQMTWF